MPNAVCVPVKDQQLPLPQRINLPELAADAVQHLRLEPT